MQNKKANLNLYILLTTMGLLVISLVAIIIPIGIQFSAEMYKAQENIIDDTSDDINSISDTTIRETTQSYLKTGKDTTKDNIKLYSFFYENSGVILLVLGLLVLFFYSRTLSEQNLQGGIAP